MSAQYDEQQQPGMYHVPTSNDTKLKGLSRGPEAKLHFFNISSFI